MYHVEKKPINSYTQDTLCTNKRYYLGANSFLGKYLSSL
jgi:hypothetical protein